MGLSRQQMEEELNTGMFYKRLIPSNDTVLWNIAQSCAEEKKVISTELKMQGADGKILSIAVDADYVDDALGDVKCILSMRKK